MYEAAKAAFAHNKSNESEATFVIVNIVRIVNVDSSRHKSQQFLMRKHACREMIRFFFFQNIATC